MKKPSVDFNAIGPDFMHKMSAAAAQFEAEDQENAKSGGKRPGKIFWNLASSLRKMVTKRLGSKSPSKTMNNGEHATPSKQPDFAN